MRIEKIRVLLKDKHADALVVFNREDSGQPSTEYISGFSGSDSVLLLGKKAQFILTDGRYFSRVRKEALDFRLIKRDGSRPEKELFADVLKKLHAKTILFDGTQTLYASIERFKKYSGKVTVKNAEYILREIREIKDPEEIKYLAKASAIACVAFKKLLPRIKPGIKEVEVAALIEKLMFAGGAKKIAFPTIVASGRNGAAPHAKATDKRLKKGELVTIDFGCYYRGYASDMTRTVAIGKVSEKLKDMYEAVRVSQAAGCTAIREGITGEALDAICRDVLVKRGYGKYFVHATGHGVGRDVHEMPYVSRAGKKPIMAGSAITIEPGVYIDGVGGVRIEDTLIVKKNVAANLTGSVSKDLIIL